MNVIGAVSRAKMPSRNITSKELKALKELANDEDILISPSDKAGPRGGLTKPSPPPWNPDGPGAVGYGWYPLVPGTAPEPHELRTARDHILKFLDAAADRYPIDRKKLAVVGFSQGGVMAYSLAFGAPERFAGLAALSTWCPPDAVENVADPDTLRYLATSSARLAR